MHGPDVAYVEPLSEVLVRSVLITSHIGGVELLSTPAIRATFTLERPVDRLARHIADRLLPSAERARG